MLVINLMFLINPMLQHGDHAVHDPYLFPRPRRAIGAAWAREERAIPIGHSNPQLEVGG